MSKVKICGLMRQEDVKAVNRCLPDYVGFILASGRRRTITPELALSLRQSLRPEILPVAVFVDETEDTILSAVESGIASVIQLHGKERPELIRSLQKKTHLPVIQAFSVSSAADVKRAERCPADHLLFDCGIGGTGKTFNWAFLKGIKRSYFLAGGIGLSNLDEALRLSPDVIDVSSGAETNGIKDPAKIQEIVRRIRNGK